MFGSGYTAGPGFARYCAVVCGILFALTGTGMLLLPQEQKAIDFLRSPGILFFVGSAFFLYLGIRKIPKEEKKFNQLKTEEARAEYVVKSMSHLWACIKIQKIILGIALAAALIALIYGLHKTIFP